MKVTGCAMLGACTLVMGLLSTGYGQGHDRTTKPPHVIHHGEEEGAFTTVSAPTTLRVVTIEEEPYLTVTKSSSNATDAKNEYSGFIVDVLDEIFKDTDMRYDLSLVPDGKYGQRDRHTGVWDGMIGDVKYGEAHIAAAALSITAARVRVVDFSHPWAEVNLTVIVQSDAPVTSLAELVSQRNISYGLIKGGSTQNAFATATTEPYTTMWDNMDSDELFVSSRKEGIERVQNDSEYGFILETPMAEFTVNTICGLKTVGSFLPQGGYGFAVNKGDDTGLKKLLDDSIKTMKDNGMMRQLHVKYWGEETCDERSAAWRTQWLPAAILCSLLAAMTLV